MKMETRCFLRVTFLGSLLAVSTSYMNEGDSTNFVPEEHENWDNLNHRSCGFSMRQRIIGGNTVPLGTYPWLVRVGKERPTDGVLTFPCGGAILNRFYVLTAAHCFRDQKSLPTLVRIGEYDVSSTTDCFQGFCAPPVQDIPIHWYFIPKHFSVEYMENDIALIELKRPIHFSETVQPICMPPYSISSSNLTGKVGEVAGWGLNDIHLRTTPTVMNAVSLKIVENEWCDKYKYRQSNFPFNIICAGGEPGHDSCSGDSGGPLMVPLTAEGYSRYYIIGVVSYGPQACGETDKPGVYTYIPQFQSWILNYITKK